MRFRSIIYWLAFALLVVLVALVVHWALVRDTDPFVPKTDNTLRRWLFSDPSYLNPILRTSVNAAYALEYMNHYLLDWDMEHSVNIPKLAKSWEISEDGLDYAFPLRTDVKWQDGVPFDADDVMFSFATVMDPDNPIGHARSDFMDTEFRRSLPPNDGDGVVNATEYLALPLDELGQLDHEPVMDGVPEAGAPVVAEASGLTLRAALRGSELYLCGTRIPRHDLVVFVARHPGELTDYAPAAKVAQWDAFFLADDGNTFPARTGWLASERERIAGATFALAADAAEVRIDLRRLCGLGGNDARPETIHVALVIVDDVQLEKLDRYTVRFHFPRKIYSNLDSAGYLRLVAKHYYDDGQPFMTHPKRDIPLGTGPYKFVKWDRNNSIVVERWDDYWGVRPKIKRVEFKIISDLVVAYQVFRKGDIDALGSVGVWTYTHTSKVRHFDRHFYKLAYDRPGYGYVGYNARISFFSDPRCRRAMSHLIDTRAAVRHVLNGLNPLISGPFFYKEPAYDPSLPPYEYDIAEAKRLLDEAGWTDRDGDGMREKDINGDGRISVQPLDASHFQREKFTFDCLTTGGVDVANDWVLLSLLRNCPKVGIACAARPVEYAIRMEWLRNQTWDAMSDGGWVLSMESDPYTFFHSSQAKDGFNYGGYSSREADRMMEQARQELDQDKRSALFRKLDRILWEDQPCSFLVGHNWRWVINKRVKNVRQYDLGFDFLQWELEGHEDGN